VNVFAVHFEDLPQFDRRLGECCHEDGF
jgi:hypothetical protein